MSGIDDTQFHRHCRLLRPKKKKPRHFDISGITAIAPPESQVPQSFINTASSQIEDGTNLEPETSTDVQMVHTPAFPNTPNPQHQNAGAIARPKHWYDDLDIRDLEAWVMNELERLVCLAEERDVMKHLDIMILKHEEYDVMKKLLHHVHFVEDLEFAASLPSLVENMTKTGQTSMLHESGRSLMLCGETKYMWDKCRRKNSRESHNGSISSNSGSQQNNSKLVGDCEIVKMMKCRQKLPKWVPCENKNLRELIFTRQDYWTRVVRPLLTLPEFEANPNFKITLSQHDLDDPHSYHLEAEGTTSQLTKLLSSTKKYMRAMIADHNIAKLWNDVNSLLFDVSVSSQAKLGVLPEHSTFRRWGDTEKSIPGVWIREIKNDGALFQVLGDALICDSGCMIVAVDREHVFLPTHIRTTFHRAKKSSKPFVTVTLCISKYADLSRLSNSLKKNLKYRNGELFDPMTHETFVKTRNAALASTRNTTETVKVEKENTTREIDEDIAALSTSVNADVVVQPREEVNADLARFKNFELKYRQLVELEFKNTNFDQKKIFLSMWHAHRMLFGENSSCDDACTCFQETAKMVVNARSSVDSDANVQKKTTGVLEYFLPRFIHRLKNEYPQESIADLFQRVIDLWSEHQANGLYGFNCDEYCQCVQELDGLFGKGNKTSSGAFNTSLSRTTWRNASSTLDESLNSAQDPTESYQSGVSGTADFSADRLLTKKRYERESFRHTPELKRQRLLNPSGRAFSPTSHDISRRPFEAVFDTNKPIGGYFVTELGVDGAIGCHLFSKFVNGAIATDSRIRLGSTVTAVVMGERRKDISSHTELKQFYDYAKSIRRRLHLIIETRGGLHGLTDSSENWTSAGNWVGRRSDGWSGGANDESEAHRPVENVADPTPPICYSVLPASVPEQDADHVDPLANAVYCQTSKELIELLNLSYYPRDRTEVETQLIPHYKFVREKLDSLNASAAKGEDIDPSLPYRIQDWKAKYIALKICIDSVFEIEKATSIEAWNDIEFRVEQIKLQRNRSSHRLVDKIVAATIKTRNPDSVLGSLPTKFFSSNISYGTESSTFLVHNHSLFSSEDKFLVIDVEARTHEEDHHPIMIGSFIFTFNEIEQIFLSNTVWVTYSKSFPGMGSIEISARRQSAKHYILQKKNESILGLKKLIDAIQNFNEDTDLPAYATMSGNVRGIGGVSLLHAAIELVDTADVIETLLRLKADPLAPSHVGTPMEAAEILCGRLEQKLDDVRRLGKPNDVIEVHRQRYLQALKNQELLQINLKDNQKDDKLDLQKGDGKSGCRRVRFALLDTAG